MLGTRTANCRLPSGYWPSRTTSRCCSSRSSTSLPPRWPARRWPGSRAPPDPTSGSPPRRRPASPRSSRPSRSTRRWPPSPRCPPTRSSRSTSARRPSAGPVQAALATRPVSAPRRHRADRAHSRPRPRRAAPADRRAARPRCAIALDDAGSGYRLYCGPAAADRQAGPGARQRRRHRPGAGRAGRDARRVRRPHRRLAARRGHRDTGRAGRVRPAGRPAGARLAARPPGPGYALAPEATRLVRACVACARLTDTVAGLLRPVRQSALGEDVPGPPACWWSAGRTGRTVARRPPDGGDLHRPRLAARTPRPASATPCAGPHAAAGPALRPRHLHRPEGDVLGLPRIEDLASAARKVG